MEEHEHSEGEGKFVDELMVIELQAMYETVTLLSDYLDLVHIASEEEFDPEQIIDVVKGWAKDDAEGSLVRFLGLIKLALGQVALMQPEACCPYHAVEDMKGDVEKLIAARRGGIAN